MTGPRRPRRPGSRPKGFEGVPELSPEEVERRVDVRGGGVPLAPAPVERPVRDLRRPRSRRNMARESLLLLGLAVIGLVTLRVVLPEGPLTASATDAPSGSAAAVATVTTPTLGPSRTPGLQTLVPIGSPIVPGTDAPPSLAPTAEPAPTPTLKPGATPRPTPVVTRTPTPTKTPTPTAAPTAPNRATVIVIMQVINDDDGTAVAADWTLKVTGEVGGNVVPNNFPGSATGTSVSIPSGKGYLVTDNLAVPGYGPPTASAGCRREAGSGGLAPGAEVTCTITRNDNEPAPTETPAPLVWILPVLGRAGSGRPRGWMAHRSR